MQQRWKIIHLYQDGRSGPQIKETIGCALSTVQQTIQRYQLTGDVLDKSKTGRPKSVYTDENIAAIRREVRKSAQPHSPRKSPRRLASMLGISHTSVRNVMKKRLHVKALKTLKVQQLTEANKESRVARCQRLLDRFSDDDCNSILFTDECLFHVTGYLNKQNTRIYAKSVAAAGTRRLNPINKFSKSVMVWAGVSKIGNTDIYMCPAGVKVNGQQYRQMITDFVIPQTRTIFGEDNWTFQQDSAPAHRAALTQTLCETSFPRFISCNDWPSNSPDASPLDYCIWAYLKEKVYKQHFSTIPQLKLAIQREWANMPANVVQRSIDQWRPRLQCIVDNEGGHIEHLYR